MKESSAEAPPKLPIVVTGARMCIDACVSVCARIFVTLMYRAKLHVFVRICRNKQLSVCAG